MYFEERREREGETNRDGRARDIARTGWAHPHRDGRARDIARTYLGGPSTP